jgi:methionyl-tRNA formyltransferase
MSQPRIAVFASSCMSLALIDSLRQSGALAGVVVSFGETPQRQEDTRQLLANLQQMALPSVQYQPQAVDELLQTLDRWQASWGVVFTFPKLLPEAVIGYFNQQIFNIHASDLPNYRGSMPVYWQLRHNLDEIQLSLHQLEATIDSGAIGHQLAIPVHPFDNFQTLNFKVMQQAPLLVQEVLALHQRGELEWHSQRSLRTSDFYAREVNQQDALLNWAEHSAKEFVGAARAGNPHHGGVMITSYCGQFQVMQISAVDTACYGTKPGTVLMVDKFKGWIVSTREGSVSLDVIVSQDGYFSGYQFAVRQAIEAGTVL